jgi:Flp pilus assembly pilin Flp
LAGKVSRNVVPDSLTERKRIVALWKAFIKDQSGAALVEQGILASIVGCVLIEAATRLGVAF